MTIREQRLAHLPINHRPNGYLHIERRIEGISPSYQIDVELRHGTVKTLYSLIVSSVNTIDHTYTVSIFVDGVCCDSVVTADVYYLNELPYTIIPEIQTVNTAVAAEAVYLLRLSHFLIGTIFIRNRIHLRQLGGIGSSAIMCLGPEFAENLYDEFRQDIGSVVSNLHLIFG